MVCIVRRLHLAPCGAEAWKKFRVDFQLGGRGKVRALFAQKNGCMCSVGGVCADKSRNWLVNSV